MDGLAVTTSGPLGAPPGRVGRAGGRGRQRGRKSLLTPPVSLAGASLWMHGSGGIGTGSQRGSGYPLESRGSPSLSPLGQRPWSPATTGVWTLIWSWTVGEERGVCPERTTFLVLASWSQPFLKVSLGKPGVPFPFPSPVNFPFLCHITVFLSLP